MRRSLIITVAAAVTMVLLAMLVPMAVLLRSYALEDRIAQAALEVQATETVVSGADDRGAVSAYLDRINTGDGIDTTVFYPEGEPIGPDKVLNDRNQARLVTARNTGTARVDDVAGGSAILIPVSLGRTSALPEQTPVIRILVATPGLDPDLVRSWLTLVALGLVLLVGALVLADRLGSSFVRPIGRLAEFTQHLGDRRRPEPVPAEGPPEVRELGEAMNRLVGRIETLLERERASVADVSHRLRTPMTALRLRVESLDDDVERARVGTELDRLQATVDLVVREARRSEREGLVAASDAIAVLGERCRFWAPLAEDQQRDFRLEILDPGPVLVGAAEEDLVALIDVLLDNVFSHTPDDAAVRVRLSRRAPGGVRLVVEDGGPGFPVDVSVVERGESGAGSTGLGLSIVQKTATESGGGLRWGASDLGGAEVVVDLGGA